MALKQATILGYGDISPAEQELFRRLVGRNAANMNFAGYRVLFSREADLEQTVQREVTAWLAS